MWGRGLKRHGARVLCSQQVSPPMWGRGLKHDSPSAATLV